MVISISHFPFLVAPQVYRFPSMAVAAWWRPHATGLPFSHWDPSGSSCSICKRAESSYQQTHIYISPEHRQISVTVVQLPQLKGIQGIIPLPQGSQQYNCTNTHLGPPVWNAMHRCMQYSWNYTATFKSLHLWKSASSSLTIPYAYLIANFTTGYW